jgi:hypothetical protein
MYFSSGGGESGGRGGAPLTSNFSRNTIGRALWVVGATKAFVVVNAETSARRSSSSVFFDIMMVIDGFPETTLNNSFH